MFTVTGLAGQQFAVDHQRRIDIEIECGRTAPEFGAMRGVGGVEVEIAPEGGEVVRVGVIGAAVDVFDQRRGGAIRAPELVARCAVVSGEVEPVAEGGKAVRFGVGGATVDITKPGRNGAIRTPELIARCTVVGIEVKVVT